MISAGTLERPPVEVSTVALADLDGTLFSTPGHMKGDGVEGSQGFNGRLAAAFGISDEVFGILRATRVALRKEHPGLSHAQQAVLWEQQEGREGLSFDSQLDFYRGELPEIFTEQLMERIWEWAENSDNFGHGEYADVPSYLQQVRAIGAMTVLCTLGQQDRPGGKPGWQRLKIRSAPDLEDLPYYITPTLPDGGKAELVREWYDAKTGNFLIPRTDGGAPVSARGAVLIDDQMSNLRGMPPQAMGVFLDRKGERERDSLPENVQYARSLAAVPGMISKYDNSRKNGTGYN